MEKQIKVLISSEDGEWSAGPLEKLRQRGAAVLLVERRSAAASTDPRGETPCSVNGAVYAPYGRIERNASGGGRPGTKAGIHNNSLLQNAHAGERSACRGGGAFCGFSI